MFSGSHLLKRKLSTIHIILIFLFITVTQFMLNLNLNPDSDESDLLSSNGEKLNAIARLDDRNWAEEKATHATNPQCLNAKDKFMFIKNGKAGSSTIESIMLQIATHYHNYEIVHTRGTFRGMKKEKDNVGYYIPVSHQMLELKRFQKLFPRNKYLWFVSFRNVEEQINSAMRWRNYVNRFNEQNFDDEFKRIIKSRDKEFENMLLSNSMSHYLLGSCSQLNLTEFEECASEILDSMDLIIPLDTFDESMVILHKLTCLPLKDFAYVQMKKTKTNFQLSDENMNKVLKFHSKDLWFERKARKKFQAFFQSFQAEFCSSENCSYEVAQLREENEKLKNDCGLTKQKTGRLQHIAEFSFDWDKMAQDSLLALRCLSFALSVKNNFLIDIYNDVLQGTMNSEDFAGQLALKWIERLRDLNQTFT